MSNLPADEIQVWDTGEDLLVVWGTHDIKLASELATTYYNDYVGIEYIPEGIQDIVQKGNLVWCEPSLIDLDEDTPWPEEKIMKERREGWVTVLIATL